jgi:hypothetical protein
MGGRGAYHSEKASSNSRERVVARTPSVPYCTVKGFRIGIDILRREPLDVVDRQVLVDRGLSPHAVYPVLGAFRFLGLIDEDGRPGASVASFLDEGDVAGRRRIVEAAYRAVLADVSFPVDDREEIDRLLIERHEVAPGVAAFCSTFFLWLAAESGLPVADIGRNRRGRPPAHLAQLSDTARAVLMTNELARAAQAVTVEELGRLASPGQPATAPHAIAAAPELRRTSEA